MCDSPMKKIAPRLYWADRRVFLYPGLHMWAFGRHWRLLPLPRAERR